MTTSERGIDWPCRIGTLVCPPAVIHAGTRPAAALHGLTGHGQSGGFEFRACTVGSEPFSFAVDGEIPPFWDSIREGESLTFESSIGVVTVRPILGADERWLSAYGAIDHDHGMLEEILRAVHHQEVTVEAIADDDDREELEHLQLLLADPRGTGMVELAWHASDRLFLDDVRWRVDGAWTPRRPVSLERLSDEQVANLLEGNVDPEGDVSVHRVLPPAAESILRAFDSRTPIPAFVAGLAEAGNDDRISGTHLPREAAEAVTDLWVDEELMAEDEAQAFIDGRAWMPTTTVIDSLLSMGFVPRDASGPDGAIEDDFIEALVGPGATEAFAVHWVNATKLPGERAFLVNDHGWRQDGEWDADFPVGERRWDAEQVRVMSVPEYAAHVDPDEVLDVAWEVAASYRLQPQIAHVVVQLWDDGIPISRDFLRWCEVDPQPYVTAATTEPELVAAVAGFLAGHAHPRLEDSQSRGNLVKWLTAGESFPAGLIAREMAVVTREHFVAGCLD